MPYPRPPIGITPPAPGLDREEPTFVPEEDIPTPADSRPAGRSDRAEDRPQHRPERE